MTRDWKTRELEINEFYMAELRGEIARRRLSQDAAAVLAGVTQSQLSRWLRNDGVMSAARFANLARAIGADPARAIANATQAARDAGVLEPRGADTPDERIRRLESEHRAMRLVSERDAMIAAEHEEPGMLLAARVANDDDEAEAQNNEA